MESVGLVELAPNPKVARNRREDSKKRDRRCGTIESGNSALSSFTLLLTCMESRFIAKCVLYFRR